MGWVADPDRAGLDLTRGEWEEELKNAAVPKAQPDMARCGPQWRGRRAPDSHRRICIGQKPSFSFPTTMPRTCRNARTGEASHAQLKDQISMGLGSLDVADASLRYEGGLEAKGDGIDGDPPTSFHRCRGRARHPRAPTCNRDEGKGIRTGFRTSDE